MEIREERSGDGIHLWLRGRLDAAWAGHVGERMDALARAGYHRLTLQLGGIDYLGSAGIRVLMKHCRILAGIGGGLRVSEAVGPVLEVLELSGLTSLLGIGAPRPEDGGPGSGRSWTCEGVEFVTHAFPESGGLRVECVGNPAMLGAGRRRWTETRRVSFGEDRVGIGLGGLGGMVAAGELVGVPGLVVAQPVDGRSVPDFEVVTQRHLPMVSIGYGILLEGTMSTCVAFDAAKATRGSVGLSRLIRMLLEERGWAGAGLVVLAETRNVVGAGLRRVPMEEPGWSWEVDRLRDRLMFTSDRDADRRVLLAAGLVEGAPDSERLPFLRRVGPGWEGWGHVHGAMFGYRPLARRCEPVAAALGHLMEGTVPEGVLHLLADERAYDGVGETELVRGRCWIGEVNA